MADPRPHTLQLLLAFLRDGDAGRRRLAGPDVDGRVAANEPRFAVRITRPGRQLWSLPCAFVRALHAPIEVRHAVDVATIGVTPATGRPSAVTTWTDTRPAERIRSGRVERTARDAGLDREEARVGPGLEAMRDLQQGPRPRRIRPRASRRCRSSPRGTPPRGASRRARLRPRSSVALPVMRTPRGGAIRGPRAPARWSPAPARARGPTARRTRRSRTRPDRARAGSGHRVQASPCAPTFFRGSR